jgi:hypothetical protein
MKESEFNRSEWVNEEIERARHWKEQGLTPEDGRGQAKLLRMELMLANAGCAQLLFQRFEENPTATPDDLKKYIQGRELVAHPKEVEKFIEEMVNKKKEVDEVIKQFSKKTEGDQQKLAKKIFRNLVPFSYWGLWKHRGVPKGPVELITTMILH